MSAATLLEELAAALERAARHCASGEAPPAALLWTDPDAQWRELVPRLRELVPGLFTLGAYQPAAHTGPVIWLRCVVERAIPSVEWPPHAIPVLYLPGVARQTLRAAEDCPPDLQPLVELLYRGRAWHQVNGRDWTVEAFLSGDDALALDVARDALTRETMLRTLPFLADAPLQSLRDRGRLDAAELDRLVSSDWIRDVLQWLGGAEGAPRPEYAPRWGTFLNNCRTNLAFDPGEQSAADAAARLQQGGQPWDDVWLRFTESPSNFPGVTRALRENVAGGGSLFHQERNPVTNELEETRLRQALEAVAELPAAPARARIAALETEHAHRRLWVWARVGLSPYAMCMEALAPLARLTSTPHEGTTLAEVMRAYASEGWRCDRAALAALCMTQTPAEATLVRRVVRALYEPWLDATARHFQRLVAVDEMAAWAAVSGTRAEPGDCVLFVDGLRFDVAQWLADRLARPGLEIDTHARLAPLPTVTATAKPLALPANDVCGGAGEADEFCPSMRVSGKPSNAARLREELTRDGLQVLDGESIFPPSRPDVIGWGEIGRIDERGHADGIDLVRQLDFELEALEAHVVALLDAGWKRVRLVTDHGWLLMPGGLPKVELPPSIVASKWTRCALVLGDSHTTLPTYMWHWDTLRRFVSPPGIASFRANDGYAHGGVSPQECVVPEMTVRKAVVKRAATIAKIEWRGLRCRIAVGGATAGAQVDIRRHRDDPSSSLALGPKPVDATGAVSLLVQNEDSVGAGAVIVLLAGDQVIAQRATTVGENS